MAWQIADMLVPRDVLMMFSIAGAFSIRHSLSFAGIAKFAKEERFVGKNQVWLRETVFEVNEHIQLDHSWRRVRHGCDRSQQ